MGKYEDTLKEIETTIGLVPGFMKARAYIRRQSNAIRQ